MDSKTLKSLPKGAGLPSLQWEGTRALIKEIRTIPINRSRTELLQVKRKIEDRDTLEELGKDLIRKGRGC